MSNALGVLFLAAIGVAISPVPIVAVILALFSRHPRRNGLLFLAGWVFGVVIMVGIVLLLPGDMDVKTGGLLATASATIKLIIGLLFIVIAFAVRHQGVKGGEERPLPAWTSRIEGLSAVQSLLLAVGLAVINPKNLVISLAVVLAIAESGLELQQVRLALLLYVLISSAAIATPVFYRVLAGKQADRQLQHWKVWLVDNNSTIMFVLLLVMGAVLFGRGLGAILQQQ